MPTKKKAKGKVVAIREPQSDEQTMLALVAKAATDPAFDAEKFKILMEARAADRMEQAKTIFGAAMAEVQAKIEPVRRDAANPQTRSRYASYEALDRAIRPTYTGAGFALSFSTITPDEPGTMLVTCRVRHRAGYTEFYQLPIPIVTKGPKGNEVMTATHAAMSAKTYGMRGLLQMIFNVAMTDDDGNAAGGKDMTPISDEQLWKLGEMIKETGSDLKAFCEYMEVDALPQLLASDYQRAVDALDEKKKQNAAKAAKA